MVKEVSGDWNDVRMIQKSGGIHEFEPSASDVWLFMKQMSLCISDLESWAGSLILVYKKSKVAS